MEQSMNGLVLKSVDIVRASGIIGLINLTYNLFSYEQTIRIKIIFNAFLRDVVVSIFYILFY